MNITIVWHWPQILVVVLWIITIILFSIVHGTEKTGRHNVVVTIYAIICNIIILYFGGFFLGNSP